MENEDKGKVSSIAVISRPRIKHQSQLRSSNVSNLVSVHVGTKVTQVHSSNRSLSTVMLVNARSLLNKINELQILVEMNNIDIVCITETLLSDKIPDEAIDGLSMNLCRLDRFNAVGEGVAVFISNVIPFKVRKDLLNRSF